MASRTTSIYNSRIKPRGKDIITFARRKSRNATARLCLCSSQRCRANLQPQHWPSPVNTSASWFARNSHDHPPASLFRGHILGFQECPSLAHGAGRSMSRAKALSSLSQKYKSPDVLLQPNSASQYHGGSNGEDVHGGTWVVCDEKQRAMTLYVKAWLR